MSDKYQNGLLNFKNPPPPPPPIFLIFKEEEFRHVNVFQTSITTTVKFAFSGEEVGHFVHHSSQKAVPESESQTNLSSSKQEHFNVIAQFFIFFYSVNKNSNMTFCSVFVFY